MAATAIHSSSPATRCFLVPPAATKFRHSFVRPISSINARRCAGFSGLSSLSTANPLRRFGCLLVSAGQDKRRRWRPAFSSSLQGNDNDNDEEAAAASDSGSGSSIDLKLPRRRLLVQFTCNECGERTSRLVNRLAYERGLIYVQCAGCLRHHKLVDNLGLVMEYDLRDESNVKSDTDQDIYS